MEREIGTGSCSNVSLYAIHHQQTYWNRSSRQTWTSLNRIRTNCGRCPYSLHRIGPRIPDLNSLDLIRKSPGIFGRVHQSMRRRLDLYNLSNSPGENILAITITFLGISE
nr:unnamed protein product [Callosobruchus chinensis]